MREQDLTLTGSFLIRALDADTGRLVKVWRVNNQLMRINQSVRTQMLMGSYTGGADALAVKYFAFGTGDEAVTPEDTALDLEVYRKQITQMQNPEAGVVQTVVSLGAQECNYHIREIGVFAGPDAAITAGSGTLLSRILVDIEKNTNIVLNIVRTDTCAI